MITDVKVKGQGQGHFKVAKIEFIDGFFSPLNICRRNAGLVPKCQEFCAFSDMCSQI